MKLWKLIPLLGLLLVTPADAAHHGNSTAVSSSPNFTFQSYYNSFSGGWVFNQNKLPIGLWNQPPTATGSASYSGSPSPNTMAGAAALRGANVFVGFGVGSWPENSTTDNGEMAAIKAANIYAVGGFGIQYLTNTGAATVSAANTVATAAGAQANLISFGIGDEPGLGGCNSSGSGPFENQVVGAVSAIQGFDSTRSAYDNAWTWVTYYYSNPPSGCAGTWPGNLTASLTATYVSSLDHYVEIDPNNLVSSSCPAGAHFDHGNFKGQSADCLWTFGLGVQNLISLNSNAKPAGSYIAWENDALGTSGQEYQGTNVAGTATSGSNLLNNTTSNPLIQFTTELEVGLTVQIVNISSGLSCGTFTVSSVNTVNQLVMSGNATANCATNTPVYMHFTGGDDGHACRILGSTATIIDMCAPFGNQYRDTAVQDNSLAWMLYINGGQWLEIFPNDLTTSSFSLGASPGGAAAAAAATNLQTVTTALQTYAPEFQEVPDGRCTMQNNDLTTTSSCTNGILTFATGTAACPGSALATKGIGSLAGYEVVFVMTDRNSTSAANCNTTGATFTTTLSGKTGTATVIYDSNATYDAGNDTTGATHTLSANAFTDTLGDHSDSYRVKVYKVQ